MRSKHVRKAVIIDHGDRHVFHLALGEAGAAGRLLPKFVGQFADAVDRDRNRVDRLLHDADADRGTAGDRSPGNSVMSREIMLTSCCAEKIMSEIG
jgi:hypothetical protein